MKGPAAAPTALKILKGVRPARINQNEPKPRSVSGNIPSGWSQSMSDGAKRFWKKYAPILSGLGILTEADLPALRILAELWSQWLKVTLVISKGGMTYETETGYQRERPEVKLADKLETQMLRYLQHFGMTASSRGNLSVSGLPDEEDGYLD